MDRRDGVTAIVLAGGRGSRLGGVDKARLEIGGATTLDRARAAVGEIAAEQILIANEQEHGDLAGIRVIRDPEPHGGVLPALLAALDAAGRPRCLVVACDMPFLNPRLLGWLVDRLDGHDVVIPTIDGQLQPMHAAYRRDPCRAAIAAALARGDRRMISFHRDLRVRVVAEAELRRLDPDLRSFFNVNTPEELAEARRLAGT
jgi:molybdenum cofactor guanylyltransferase